MSKEEVTDLYINQNLTINEVAERLKANRTVLMSLMVKNNISKEDKIIEEKAIKLQEFRKKINTSEIKQNYEW